MAKRTGDEKLDFLFEGILTLKTVDECYDFFGDLWRKQGLARRRSRVSTAAFATETTDM